MPSGRSTRGSHGGLPVPPKHFQVGDSGSQLEAKSSTEAFTQGPCGSLEPALSCRLSQLTFSWGYIHPLAQHKLGTSREHGRHHRSPQGWAGHTAPTAGLPSCCPDWPLPYPPPAPRDHAARCPSGGSCEAGIGVGQGQGSRSSEPPCSVFP